MNKLSLQNKKILSCVLFVVFLYSTTPATFLHNIFAHHHDTVDKVLKKGETVVDTNHVHCSFLSFVCEPFLPVEATYLAFETIIYDTTHLVAVYHYRYLSSRSAISPRGPPADYSVAI